MTSNKIGTIEWPDESKIIKRNVADATFDYIQNIFYNTALVVTSIYLGLKLVLVPCLEQQYSQRNKLSAFTLLKLRKLTSQLQNCLRNTPVAVIGYNKSDNTIERCTQTSEDKFEQLGSSWPAINKRLTDSTTYLQQFVNSNSNESRSLCEFNKEARGLSEQFNIESGMELQGELSRKLVTSVREVKGWFVSGRIH